MNTPGQLTPSPPVFPAEPSLPPARDPGGWLDLLLFLGASLVLLLAIQVLGSVLIGAYMYTHYPQLSPQEILDKIQYNAFLAIPIQIVYDALLLLLLFLLVRVLRGLPFWRTLALRRLPLAQVGVALAAGVLLALAITPVNVLFPPPETPAIEKLLSSRAAAYLLLGTGMLVAPLVEELVFRGYIYALLERKAGAPVAVLASGILFGSIHFPQLWPGFAQMVLICLVGIVFGVARAQTGTVLASILLHLGYNATQSILYVLSPQFSELPPI